MATLDVGGQIFKVSAALLRSKPSTLLAQLIDGASGANDEPRSAPPNGGRPIFVDAAPERFTCILDWYRYGEIHVPRSLPVAAVLQDAKRFQLPHDIVVNGVSRSVGPNIAQKVGRDLMENVVRRWPGFAVYLTKLLDSIREHFQAVGEASGAKPGSAGHQRPPRTMAADQEDAGAGGVGEEGEEEEEEAYDFPPFVLPLYDETGWVDKQHVCTAARARALALRIEERGYCCDFTEAELLVTLPLRLKGESAVEGPYGEDEGDYPEEEEEEAAAGAAPEHAGA
mmetsp:Transcript_18830/g.47252  ORF Transcript_18830/g.47252 Transcript_18830/m.47252 type:complete len:283 (+) Transcript_18830:95-943(+)